MRVVGAALDGGVVRDDDALAAFDDPDSRDDARRRRVSAVELPGRERVQLEEGTAGIDEPIDALASSELASRAMALDRLLPAAPRDQSRSSRSSVTRAAIRS